MYRHSTVLLQPPYGHNSGMGIDRGRILEPMKRALILTVCGVLVVLVFSFMSGCKSIGTIEETRGTHGFRHWSSDTLNSFSTENNRICIPHGWMSVGVRERNQNSALFEGESGFIIRTDAFASTTLTFAESSYIVTLLEPVGDSAERRTEIEAMVRNAFEHIGALYGDRGGTPHVHTILVTAGLSGADTEAQSIYPDPNKRVSYIILPPAHPRSEELFLHAVMHLYNEYDPRIPYAAAQAPFTDADFREMEAAWGELAFESSDRNRLARGEYLLNVHEAVVTKDFSRISAPPFTDAEAFARMLGKLPVPADASYDDLDTQYGHYVLGPLILVGIDGMLKAHGTSESVETLLTKVHTGALVSFYGALRTELPDSDIQTLKSWIDGGAAIPEDLVRAGIARYDRGR